MSTSPTTPFGKRGEQLAADYLKRQGYTILEVNWHCKYGEIDIIAQQAAALIFVEVRTRHAKDTERAFESITSRKQKRMIATAEMYIATHDLGDADWRVDVIGIAIPAVGAPIIDHAEDALGW
jgi:putative endonuclease